MGSDEHRWQAAMGAIAGSLVADALLTGGDTWTKVGAAATQHAEDLLGGLPTPVDVGPAEAVPLAVGLSVGASPLLVEPATIELIDHVRASLDGTAHELADPLLVEAARLADSSYAEAVEAAGQDRQLAMLAGAFVGLRGGIGAVPARLVSTIDAPNGRKGRRYLSRLVDRMLDLHRIDWYDPRNRRGPKEVIPGVWLSNLYGLSAFTVEHPDGLVLSLCDIEGRLDNHAHQITFHIDDTPKPAANPRLSIVIDEVLHEVREARASGQPVLVHCRHGASRTGLILRLLLAEDLGLDPEDALTEAQCLWPHTSTWNKAWAREIERRSI